MFVLSARINAQKFPGVFALLAPKHVQIYRISVLSTPQNARFSKISVLSAPKDARFSKIVVLFAPKNRQHLKMHDFPGRIVVLLAPEKLNFPGEQKPQPVRNFSVRNYFFGRICPDNLVSKYCQNNIFPDCYFNRRHSTLETPLASYRIGFGPPARNRETQKKKGKI